MAIGRRLDWKRLGQNHPDMKLKRLPTFAFVCALMSATSFVFPGHAAEPDRAAEVRPVRVLVACYSLTGNTDKMAAGVVEGIKRVAGVEGILKKVEEIVKADLERADGIILGCPTYYGNIPGKMKVVIDDWSWKMKVDFTDKVGGAFSTGGGQTGGKEFVVLSLLTFMLDNRMVVAGPLYKNERTGSVWGEVGASATTGPLDPGVSEAELDAARRLGERVARLAAKLREKLKTES